ncbi:MAG: thioredoxin fold domain-containing protein [Bacteroidota bacterium]
MQKSLLAYLLISLWLFDPSLLSAQEVTDVVEEGPYVAFIDGSWSEARTLAAEQGKYIMVDAYTDWCGWCKVQDKNTFHNEKVAAYMNENLVAVKIDFEKGVGIDLAMKYRVRSFPTLLFFTPEGKIAGRIVGYDPDIENFISSVESMQDEANHPPQIGDPNVLDPGFPDFYLESFGKNGKKKRIAPEVVGEWLEQQEDMYSEEVWNVIATMSLPEAQQNRYLENYQSYVDKFGKESAKGVVDNIINAKFYDAIRSKEEEKLEAVLEVLRKYGDPAFEGNLKMAYYQRTEEWTKLVAAGNSLAEAKGYESASAFNSAAWTMYEKCEDQALLTEATDWMHKVVLEDDSYAYLDTYAALLFKTGQDGLAMKWANRAIATGKRNQENVSGTEALIEKYQKEESNE